MTPPFCPPPAPASSQSVNHGVANADGFAWQLAVGHADELGDAVADAERDSEQVGHAVKLAVADDIADADELTVKHDYEHGLGHAVILDGCANPCADRDQRDKSAASRVTGEHLSAAGQSRDERRDATSERRTCSERHGARAGADG